MADSHETIKLTSVLKPAPLPTFQTPPIIQQLRDNIASEFHKRLAKWIAEFDASLDEQHEVGIRLVSFGQTITFHIENMGYWNPSLITFHGTSTSGEPVQLIQHVTQISILLMKLPRQNPGEPKRKLGFPIPGDDP